MADLRITGGMVPPPTAQPTPKSEAARAAQRAFFQAALHGTKAAEPTAPVTKSAPAPAPQPGGKSAEAGGAEPARFARPGSRLDIRV